MTSTRLMSGGVFIAVARATVWPDMLHLFPHPYVARSLAPKSHATMRSRLGMLVRRFYHRPPKQQTGFHGIHCSSIARCGMKRVATEDHPRACRLWKPHAHNVKER